MASGTSDVFEKYAKFGKTEAQVKEMKGGLRIETRNVQKLMKESGVIDSKYSTQLLDNDIMRVIGKLTTSNPTKYPKGSKTLEKEGFDALVHQIADSKKTSYEAVLEKLNSVSGPSTAGTTGVANAGNVARMTDTSKYTGAHKERFDADGKGKGADGREDRSKNTGYVGNYKNDGTYDQTHKK
ncbi:tubulin polymerization-promoting family member 2-like [Brachionus plicatilis]|uniref:Tubulin polymerization-promoting family member 2-like n=1 Tax=Brachionus plicatilis TaxID=10195 RepID=A0A3M7SH51_BRAPC|nr:tubulin polymerization-promoting family member 2-like [Brachionus plicatilis]